MSEGRQFGLYLMTAKGKAALEALVAALGVSALGYIVVSRDSNVVDDHYNEIVELAQTLDIPIYYRNETLPFVPHLMAVSWRWLIDTVQGQQLVVFHDSILPRYRGFAPLVSALINQERNIGVTALIASEQYDQGPILGQDVVSVDYPLKIAHAIELIQPCYRRLIVDVAHGIINQRVVAHEQNEEDASYSLWRDDDDYSVDWSQHADYIKRFVDATGLPYKGAMTTADGHIYRIFDCVVLSDVKIENRTVGKVIFNHDGFPVVVCGTGLLKLLHVVKEPDGANALPLDKFRTRFV